MASSIEYKQIWQFFLHIFPNFAIISQKNVSYKTSRDQFSYSDAGFAHCGWECQDSLKKGPNRNFQIATFYSLASFKDVPAKIHFSLLGLKGLTLSFPGTRRAGPRVFLENSENKNILKEIFYFKIYEMATGIHP